MGLNLLRLFQQTDPDKPLGGRYKIISQLAVGGFGQTFLAQDLHLPDHPQCVVKQLKPQVSDEDSLQTARRLFDIEARVLYQLGNHDQIPRLLAHFEENQEFYLAQELIEGDPLTKELVEGRPWSETRVINLLYDILHVLVFVHQQNVIHRDIKPSNLMRRRHDSRIVLIDFGAVKQVSTQIVNPQSGQTRTISIGTQGYTPKEQLGGNPRFSSDVYAVGIVGIQALIGVHPKRFREDPQTGEIDWRCHATQVSPELATILDQMVRYDFRVRYPTAVEALEALCSLPSALTQSLPSPSQQQQSPPPVSEGSGTDQLSTHIWVSPNPSAQPNPTSGATGLGTDLSSTKKWQPADPPAQPHPTPETTGSGSDQLPTHIWVPPASAVQPQSSASSTSSKAPQATPEPALQSSESSVPTIATPSSPQRQSVKLWFVLAAVAVLGAVGGTFWLTRTVLFPKPDTQTADRTEVPAASPTTNPTTQQPPAPSPSGSAAASPTASPTEKSTSPSPSSPVTASPTVSPTQQTASPSPTSSTTSSAQKPTTPSSASPPATTKASPAPAQPTVKSPPPRKEPPVAELLSEADRLRQSGQYQKAIAAYDQVIASKPDVAEAYWGRCYSLNSIQQPAEAIASCNKALEFNPNYADALWSKGAALQQQQNLLEALKNYKQATDIKPNFPEAWNNQGVVLLALGRASEAVGAFDKATALKPDFANAWANRGAALWQLGRLRLAIASLDKALQIQPDNQDALNLRQQAQEKLGQ
ncbi:MAG TPA: tetratricopeptide repeat protein [Coleofasciculaceae cyanobacterium]|jgi:serine/threonine protein kinase